MALATEFQNAYDELLSAWLAHENLRHGGSLGQLSASRAHLDALRYEVALMASTLAA
jgi:hypothetical protein